MNVFYEYDCLIHMANGNYIDFPPEGTGRVRDSGGGNAREIKTKKNKKKARKDADSDDESQASSTSKYATSCSFLSLFCVSFSLYMHAWIDHKMCAYKNVYVYEHALIKELNMMIFVDNSLKSDLK